MAISLYMDDSRSSTKAHAEKPAFTQTCKLLSQFMKKKRVAIDSNKRHPAILEHKAKTMKLLTSMEDSYDDASKTIAAVMNCVPRFIQNSTNNNESDSRGKDQMTIFYCGKVLVLNDFPAENATEVMEMATKLSSNTSAMEKAQTSTAPISPGRKKMAMPAINRAEQQCPPSESEASDSNLKIAGRASLHKFFEKRKDRVTAREPYPLSNLMMTASISKPTDESSSGASDHFRDHWQSSKGLDLTL